MSDLDDSVRAVLTHQWQTTAQIAAQVPAGRSNRASHDKLVRHHLHGLVAYGIAERRRSQQVTAYRWAYEWRLKEAARWGSR